MRIRYAQCWEDPQTLRAALQVSPDDDVVSIASGGDNTFALLLDEPRSLTAVDSNPAQVFLVELKKAAIERLSYEEFAGFIGARPMSGREKTYDLLRPALSRGARAYWDENAGSIRRGIIHCGKFEGYFRIFRRLVLPLIHGRITVRRFLALRSVEEQERYYHHVWDNRRWRGLFRVFFGRFLLGRLGRDPACFRHVTLDRVAEVLLQRSKHGLTAVPVLENHYIEYIFTGRHGSSNRLPPYLRPENFRRLRSILGRLRVVCSDLDSFLSSLPAGSISRFNLSDIFEYMSDGAVESSLGQIFRASRPGARLAFWTLFIPRLIPAAFRGGFIDRSPDFDRLFSQARAFFYGSFCLWEVASGTSLPKFHGSSDSGSLARTTAGLPTA